MQRFVTMLRFGQPRLVAIAALLLFLPVACSSRPPDGPRFRPQSPPQHDQALVYLYRHDSLRGVSAMDVEIDGELLGRVGDGQYVALILRPQPLRFSFRLKRFGFLPSSWTHFDIDLRPGSTTFIRTWAGNYELDAGPDTRSLELPGRANRQASVGIFAVRRSEQDALAQLSMSYQVKLVHRGK